ncbi:MAG TPA: translation elongation factor 4 [Patescibacteria group bacterium]|nr:translation elongation factor 4 [Patescibacteria group bacterium]
MKAEKIRNFSIIAHIDHGKSTLADRILEKTFALTAREMENQVLDDMDLERERGITIKAHSVALNYLSRAGEKYLFNLIDTPGHVDFSYEVSRSLSACEGALLVVDATQGVEAQTLANAYMAIEGNLAIIPVINKIDVQSAEPERTRDQIRDVIGLDATDAILASAKEGIGIDEILEAIIERVPAPQGDPDAPAKALIFDSWYDPYRGVIMLVRVIEGTIVERQRIRLMATGRTYDAEEVGIYTPKMKSTGRLSVGEVGYIVAGMKDVSDCQIGDTVTDDKRPTVTAFPGFQKIKPLVFAGLYPTDDTNYENLRDALEKLRLNDSSFFYEPESSTALGFGFRCGFLGLLHMEIIQARLEREFNLDLLTTAPGVGYRVLTTSGDLLEISNPTKMPTTQEISAIEEPIITALIITPPEYLGGIFKLAEDRRGTQVEMKYLSPTRVLLTYALPLNEIVLDFYDKLKSLSRGYASLDYHLTGYQVSDLVKLDILVNGDPVDALSLIVHKEKSYVRGKALAEKMREVIPRQMFEVVIQASIGTRIVARETVKPMRKNVIAKCYGGDITRKRKLLEKQKEGKKRMKRVGRVEIPQEAFLAVLKVGTE